MATIQAYPVLDFSGGIRRDKSFSENQKNELVDSKNISISDRGRIQSRLGSQQVGQTLSGTIENSFIFARVTAGSPQLAQLLVNDNANTSTVRVLNGSRLTVAAAVGDTTVTVNDNSDFTASGSVEIDGDLIAYTGKGGSTLTGVTGITSAHAIGAPVHQWLTLAQSGTAVSATLGMYYAVLNNICFFGSKNNLKQFDGSTVTDVSGEPAGILLTNYRDRLYQAGDGGTGGDPRTVFFSVRGDGTTWTTASDFFTVEDQAGEPITAMRVRNDVLGIFKLNSIFTYDEIELKQRIAGAGAYNQKVVQEVDEKLFTFCPQGIFLTNLFSTKQIGEPVREYWENFIPVYDTGRLRVCTNTFAWTHNRSYFLYIGNITSPIVASDVVLEYDLASNAWTVHTGYTNMVHANNFPRFPYGDIDASGGTGGVPTGRAAVFAGDSSGKVWRFYENVFYNTTLSSKIGGNLYLDRFADTGTPVSTSFETPLYDLTHPELFKKFKRLRVYTESGQWNIEYRVEDEHGISQYKPLGSVSTTNKVLPFPSEAQGWRCGFRVSGVNPNGMSTFNGFVFEDTEVVPRP